MDMSIERVVIRHKYWKKEDHGEGNSHSFKKFQKELKRKKKAKEPLACRQGKKDQAVNDVDEQKYSD
jgi:hypothetical protein